MNKIVMVAAALSALIAVAHVFGGGPQYHVPALSSNLSTEDKAIYSILWHFVSWALMVNAIALAWAAVRNGERALILFVAVQTLIFTGLLLFYGQTRLGSIFILPQWAMFLAIAMFALWGSLRESRFE